MAQLIICYVYIIFTRIFVEMLRRVVDLFWFTCYRKSFGDALTNKLAALKQVDDRESATHT